MATERRKTFDPGSGVAPLIRSVLWRRSVRVYSDDPIPVEALEEVERAASGCPSVLGAGSGTVRLVTEPSAVRELTLRITGGFVGKTNLWLRRATVKGYLVAIGDRDRSPRHRDRFFYNVDVALAGQAAILAAAQHHVGTCWMAALDESSVASFLNLKAAERVVACIPLGLPRLSGQKGWDLSSMWDRMANRLVSSRRKPFGEIHFLETFRSERKLEQHDLRRMSYSERGIVELVEALQPSPLLAGDPLADKPLSWMIEASRHAPSADNSQLWRFAVVRKPARIRRLLAAASGGEHEDLEPMAESLPPTVVVLAAAPFILKHRTREQPFYLLDVPIAMLHMLLTAEQLGIGWNALFRFHHDAVGRVVDLPERHRVVALLFLGEKAGSAGTDPPWVQVRRP